MCVHNKKEKNGRGNSACASQLCLSSFFSHRLILKDLSFQSFILFFLLFNGHSKISIDFTATFMNLWIKCAWIVFMIHKSKIRSCPLTIIFNIFLRINHNNLMIHFGFILTISIIGDKNEALAINWYAERKYKKLRA